MADNDKKFRNDSRPLCKYSPKCYQKNPEHLKKFKHAPVKNFAIFNFAGKNKKRSLDVDELTEENSKKRQSFDENVKNNDESKLNADLKLYQERPSSHNSDENRNLNKSDENLIDDAKSEKTSPEKGSKNDLGQSTKQEKHETPNDNNTSNNTTFHSNINDKPSFIEEIFLVKMPEDFYKFWNFYNSNKKAAPLFRKMRLNLVGPFDVMDGKLPVRENKADYLVHWRYFYDPPEFQTILQSTDGELHFGYYRDDPGELPVFVASNNGDCKIVQIAENIFGAINSHLTAKKKDVKYAFLKPEIDQFQDDLAQCANEHKLTLQTNSDGMKKRSKAVVAKTFHGAGIVVPYDKKSQQGYRPLIEKDDKIKNILRNVVDAESEKDKIAAKSLLQPIITMASIANDECDFGTGLELGIDFFAFGESSLHGYVENFLTMAYGMLDRDAFGEIIKIHLKHRRKGRDLSIANL